MNVKDTIIQIDENTKNPLRLHAKPVAKKDFNTKELEAVVSAMKRALGRESDGVAIAAPQIAIPLRIFVVSPLAYDEDAKWKPLVFINPTLVKRSKKNNHHARRVPFC
jgi:peptide deformylase